MKLIYELLSAIGYQLSAFSNQILSDAKGFSRRMIAYMLIYKRLNDGYKIYIVIQSKLN